jgi:hypothetical protein
MEDIKVVVEGIKTYGLNDTLDFGKYKGKTIRYLIDGDIEYLSFLYFSVYIKLDKIAEEMFVIYYDLIEEDDYYCEAMDRSDWMY